MSPEASGTKRYVRLAQARSWCVVPDGTGVAARPSPGRRSWSAQGLSVVGALGAVRPRSCVPTMMSCSCRQSVGGRCQSGMKSVSRASGSSASGLRNAAADRPRPRVCSRLLGGGAADVLSASRLICACAEGRRSYRPCAVDPRARKVVSVCRYVGDPRARKGGPDCECCRCVWAIRARGRGRARKPVWELDELLWLIRRGSSEAPGVCALERSSHGWASPTDRSYPTSPSVSGITQLAKMSSSLRCSSSSTLLRRVSRRPKVSASSSLPSRCRCTAMVSPIGSTIQYSSTPCLPYSSCL